MNLTSSSVDHSQKSSVKTHITAILLRSDVCVLGCNLVWADCHAGHYGDPTSTLEALASLAAETPVGLQHSISLSLVISETSLFRVQMTNVQWTSRSTEQFLV